MARKLGFLILAIAFGFMLSISHVRASHDWECAKYVKELILPSCPVTNGGADTPPSKDCCDTMVAVDMYCICRNIPDDVRAQISCQKLVNVAAQCQNPMDPGTQCGDYTVPGKA